MQIQVLEPGATIACEQGRRWGYNLLSSEAIPVIQQSVEIAQSLFAPLVSVRIGSLPDDRLRVLRPIEASIRIDQEGYVACNPTFREYGYGQDTFEAVDDLRDTLCELFWALEEDEDGLSADLRTTLQALREHIETL